MAHIVGLQASLKPRKQLREKITPPKNKLHARIHLVELPEARTCEVRIALLLHAQPAGLPESSRAVFHAELHTQHGGGHDAKAGAYLGTTPGTILVDAWFKY